MILSTKQKETHGHREWEGGYQREGDGGEGSESS